MKKLEYFLPRLLPWCPSAPEPLLYQALIDSAIRFCEESHCVRYITDPITVVADVPEYDIDLPQYQDLARVLRVWYGTSPYALPALGPTDWVVSDIGMLTIYPTPHTALPPGEFLFMEVATKPTRSATSVADTLWTDWIEGVVGGAVLRICAEPDQPWSNDANASKGAQAFALWRGKAQFEASKGRVRRDTVVQPRPFA